MDRGIIQDYLLEKGLNPKLLGFQYLINAIEMVSKNKTYLHNICKMLYIEVAKVENTEPYNVERAIRYSINKVYPKYTNAQFISLALIELAKKQKHR